MFGGILSEGFGYFVKAITNKHDEKIFLAQFNFFIHVHCVVVLNDTSDRGLQLAFVLVVHSDADTKLWIGIA